MSVSEKVSVIMVLMLGALPPSAVTAQLSPGPLAAPHAAFEGITNCAQCHQIGGGPSASNCLECHKELQARLDAKAGYHTQVVLLKRQPCFECHSDHAGREFQMIHWPDGQERFDHTQAGWPLQGGHRKLSCRSCHKPELIREDLQALQQRINLSKTFLGLRSDCRSCHTDVHRGQLGTGCSDCHDQQHWKPARGFNHDQARFKLTGRHGEVECGKCHPTVRGDRRIDSGAALFIRFTGLSFQNCTPCHRDVHAGKLGTDCRRCHRTTGWKNVLPNSFDHSRTRFPLRGRHARVGCTKCHTSDDISRRLKFERCGDCHADTHRGQFRKSSSAGRCEACHTERGFSPVTFGEVEHRTTDFPLTGAHLAIPCVGCHKTVTDKRGQQFRLFVFPDDRCASCHADVHRGQFADRMPDGGCAGCHRTESWHRTSFDHAKTRFALLGKHAGVACRGCHPIVNQGSSMERVLFKPLDARCAACHTDPHFGQFTKLEPQKECIQCHTPNSWQRLLFEHNRDSRFVLQGAHVNVSCGKCHLTIHSAEKPFTLYRALARTCKSCHERGGT